MSTSSWESLLTPQELLAYNQFFSLASRSKPGIVTGQEAVQFFATSGVPNQILSDVGVHHVRRKGQSALIQSVRVDLGDSRSGQPRLPHARDVLHCSQTHRLQSTW